MYFDFSEVIWLFLYQKEICEKTTVFGNQSSKFMYRKSSYVQKNKSQKWKEHTYNVLNILIVSVISTVEQKSELKVFKLISMIDWNQQCIFHAELRNTCI